MKDQCYENTVLDTDLQIEVTQVLSCCYSYPTVYSETKYKDQLKGNAEIIDIVTMKNSKAQLQ